MLRNRSPRGVLFVVSIVFGAVTAQVLFGRPNVVGSGTAGLIDTAICGLVWMWALERVWAKWWKDESRTNDKAKDE
ncbi:hypothetical protein ACXR0O_25080 [Verrucomicrobiota bacterium sgz303538]